MSPQTLKARGSPWTAAHELFALPRRARTPQDCVRKKAPGGMGMDSPEPQAGGLKYRQPQLGAKDMGAGRMRRHGAADRSPSTGRKASSGIGLHAYYEFEVSLLGAEPKIWRRFLLRATAAFSDLHQAIQAACGWENYHLFAFRDGRRTLAGVPDEDAFGESDPDASRVSLASFFGTNGEKAKRCTYEYDFGDGWEHAVALRGVAELPEAFARRLLAGARAFPREDCGGLPGYENCVRIATSGRGPKDLREWLGDWTPEAFDREEKRGTFDR